ncbi:MAG: GyrI-like domain-containing protein [Bacteroidales bacterium]|nr:GyrI-like domain-containing protein [Bacteroidales bacterium]
MEIKKIESKQVFFKSLQSSLQTLTADVGETPRTMEIEMAELGINAAGPQEWIYNGSDGDPSTQFTLDICIPVNKIIDNNPSFKTIEGKKCAIETHKGAWANLGNTYDKLFQEIMEAGESPTQTSREVYHNCNFEDQESCITEVQIELK